MVFELKSVPILLGSFQAFLLGAFLLYSSKKMINRLFFGLLLLSFSLHLFGYSVLLYPENYNKWFFVCMLTYPFLFLMGSLHYLYTKSVVDENFALERKLIIHMIPFFIVVGIFYSDLIVNGFYTLSKGLMRSVSMFFDFVTITYIFFGYQLLNRFIKGYKDNYSSTNIIALTSFKRLTLLFLIILFGYAVNTILEIIFGIRILNIDYVVSILFSLLLLSMFFEVLKQSSFLGKRDHSLAKEKRKRVLNKNTDELIIRLEKVMHEKKLYLNENLSLADVAGELSVSLHLLSQTINYKLNCNFYEFVNRYRIENAKKLLCNEDYKILAIAFESGFSNKTSFNRTFKRFTEMSPSVYRRKQLSSMLSN